MAACRVSFSPARERPALVLLGGAGAVPVYRMGRFWTLLSAGWLHGWLIHIVFT